MQSEYENLQCKSPYSVGMQENTDQKNSEHEHFCEDVVQHFCSNSDNKNKLEKH